MNEKELIEIEEELNAHKISLSDLVPIGFTLLAEVKRLRADRQECHKLLKEVKQLKAEAMHPPMYTDQKGKEYYVLKVHPKQKITQALIDGLDLLFPVDPKGGQNE